MGKEKRFALVVSAVLTLALAGCEGPAGPAGATGAAGEDGNKGNAGDDGVDGNDGQNGQDGQDGQDGLDAALDPALPTLDKVMLGVGGDAALAAMTGYLVTSAGTRSMDGEGYEPGDGAEEISTFDVVVTRDLVADGLRNDWNRALLLVGGLPLTYSEIVFADLGVVNGTDNFFFPAAMTDMPSERWAAVGKQNRLLNPHEILLDVLADPAIATEAGIALYDGVLYEILQVADDVAPIELYVSPSTGRIAKASTWENHHLKRDVPLEAIYLDWQSYNGSAVMFPGEVAISLDGELFHTETRSDVQVSPAIVAGTFDFPYGSAPVYDDVAADFGAASSQFHEAFAGLGLPFDAQQSYVAPVQAAPGVWFLGGGSHNSMAIEQQNGIVIVEAPLYPERGEAILAWAAAQYPSKPVTDIVVTHHHLDHSSGLRAFVAAGITVVTSEHNETLLREVFRAPSTVWPDALEAAPVNPVIVTVPDNGSYTIPDPLNAVRAYHLPSGHASDMLIVHAVDSDHLFNSDLWVPYGYGTGTAINPVWALELRDFIVGTIGTAPVQVGGHGYFDTFAGLDTFVNTAFP